MTSTASAESDEGNTFLFSVTLVLHAELFFIMLIICKRLFYFSNDSELQLVIQLEMDKKKNFHNSTYIDSTIPS